MSKESIKWCLENGALFVEYYDSLIGISRSQVPANIGDVPPDILEVALQMEQDRRAQLEQADES